MHPLTQCLFYHIIINYILNIHKQYGYFSDEKKITFTAFYNKDKRVVRRCCDGEENVNRREKKLLVDATHLPNRWIAFL